MVKRASHAPAQRGQPPVEESLVPIE
jgi:hypothetical protein